METELGRSHATPMDSSSKSATSQSCSCNSHSSSRLWWCNLSTSICLSSSNSNNCADQAASITRCAKLSNALLITSSSSAEMEVALSLVYFYPMDAPSISSRLTRASVVVHVWLKTVWPNPLAQTHRRKTSTSISREVVEISNSSAHNKHRSRASKSNRTTGASPLPWRHQHSKSQRRPFG